MQPLVVAEETRRALLDYLRDTFGLEQAAFESALFGMLQDPERGLFRGPFVDVRLPFRRATPEQAIPFDVAPSFLPYAHQLRAWERLSTQPLARGEGPGPRSTLVTTGTGSGKTECFLYPILDHCRREASFGRRGIKAILLYPMNALASDQAGRLATLLADDPTMRGVTAGIYVGGKASQTHAGPRLIDTREELRKRPPDILLTNYRMLDLLLFRPEDRPLWASTVDAKSLRYLVLDELHTYDGAQGSDVACLLRRLAERLGLSLPALTCVGTSATIGGEKGAAALARFASDLFGQAITADDFVREDRLSVAEAIPAPAPDELLGQIPTRAEERALVQRAQAASTAAERIGALAEAFFGADMAVALARDEVELGEALARHPLLRRLLEALHGRGAVRGPMDLARLQERLVARLPELAEATPDAQRELLGGFLSLVSAARRRDAGGAVRPFLDVQVQLWVKELRGLVANLACESAHADADAAERFAFRDEVASSEEPYAPIVHCRECGRHGYGAIEPEGSRKLRFASREVGNAYLARSPDARYVCIGENRIGDDSTGELLQEMLCPVCCTLVANEKDCLHGEQRVKRIPVRIPRLVNPTTRRFSRDCPDCGAEDALGILAARMGSLASVAVSQIFQSENHGETAGEDKKLLAFTDSVQDAAHRAGFFASRTYRFAMRTALASAVAEAGPMGMLLDQAGKRVVETFVRRMGLAETMARLMPPDLREHPAYAAYREALLAKKKTGEADARALLERRVAWEATREFGLALTAGRSLERTETAVAEIDPERVQRIAERIAIELREGRSVFLAQVPANLDARVLDWTQGMLERLRTRGGIVHPYLGPYITHGSRYLLSKRKCPEISPFGMQSVLPRFWHASSTHDAFDTLLSETTRPTWFRDFAHRVLGIAPQDGSLNDLIRSFAQLAAKEGVLVETQGKSGIAVYGLDPAVIRLRPGGIGAHCRVCAYQRTVPDDAVQVGSTCPRYRCTGQLRLVGGRRRGADGGYYQALYRKGRVERVFASEHTGLLKRDVREALERDFKERPVPDAPNLLTCTPTLEMGIDIGDLSATMLCGVPPTPANYQQRVGRAGRRTGNAFIATLAKAEDHDAYFHERPAEMMAAEVDPPGCFLDAPEMLERQLVAYAMDRWAGEAGEGVHIRPTLGLSLSAKQPNVFPASFYAHVEGKSPEILEGFVRLFPQMPEGTRAPLVAFASEGLDTPVREAFRSAELRLAELRKDIERVAERAKQVEASAEAVDPSEQREGMTLEDARQQLLEDLEQQKRGLRRVHDELLKKHPLQVLTDAGVLPNFAFPEPGVTLRSVLRVRDEDGGAGERQSAEYQRPASAALREFAPFNTFYAEGHKVRIGRIDVGTPARPKVQHYRFCPACHHSELHLPDQSVGACPRCGNPSFADVGQLHAVLRFEEAWSYAELLEASTADDSEERENRRYRITELIEIPPATVGEAWVTTGDIGFGFELLRGITLRQFNWGELGDGIDERKVGGQTFRERGFRVCAYCGQVQRPDAKKRKKGGIAATAAEETGEHVPFCDVMRKKKTPVFHELAIARQMTTEALRVLVPVELGGKRKTSATLRASMRLGLRRVFGGQATHIGMTEMTEPTQGEGERHFVVLYDQVPGGTGYLADLAKRKERFFEVLAEAHRVVESCSCQDGCYRCLFGYRDRSDRGDVSRLLARTLLAKLLEQRGSMEARGTLSDVDVSVAGESELERNFVGLLGEKVREAQGSFTVLPRRGRLAFHIQLGGSAWRMDPQVLLGPIDGVHQLCQPDFVLTPLGRKGEDVLPVAVFCDGLRYHVQPEAPKSRLGDDAMKRQAILAANGYRVWSMSWYDLEACGASGEVGAKLHLGRFPSVHRAVELMKLGKELRGMPAESSFAILFAYLQDPTPARWSAGADAAVKELLQSTKREPADAALVAGLLEPQAAPAKAQLCESLPHASIGFGRHGKGLFAVMRLFDAPERRQDKEVFERSWNAWLHAKNLLQFLDAKVTPLFVDDEWLTDLGDERLSFLLSGAPPGSVPPPAMRPGESSEASRRWTEVLTEFVAERAFLEAARASGVTAPRFDVAALADGAPLPTEVHLLFDEAKVAIVSGMIERDAQAWASAGYRALDLDAVVASPALLTSALGSR